jgi:hypothetical protein
LAQLWSLIPRNYSVPSLSWMGRTLASAIRCVSAYCSWKRVLARRYVRTEIYTASAATTNVTRPTTAWMLRAAASDTSGIMLLLTRRRKAEGPLPDDIEVCGHGACPTVTRILSSAKAFSRTHPSGHIVFKGGQHLIQECRHRLH